VAEFPHNPSRALRSVTPLRIVTLGGGTGLSTLLRGLRDLSAELEHAAGSPPLDLAAIVTVSDDGGSSGRLRRDFDILAPGDIRNCMVALAEDETLLTKLFNHRFQSGKGLEGHNFGNLFLTALTEVTGDFHEAIKVSSEVLAIRGRIFPSTLENVRLEAELHSGRSMLGETRITGSRGGIKHMRLRPRECRPVPEALEAIAEADLITLGPGSLYTSVIPNLLISGVGEAVARSSARKAYISNLMSEPGETDGYSAADHLRAVYEHSGEGLVDTVIVNNRAAPASALERYASQGAFPVEVDEDALRKMGPGVEAAPLLADGPVVRHETATLARLLVKLAVDGHRRRETSH